MIVPSTWHTMGLRYLLVGAGIDTVFWLAASSTDGTYCQVFADEKPTYRYSSE
jgi:hypothetical protein